MQTRMIIICVVLLFFVSKRVGAQDTTTYNIVKIDTFRLTEKRFKKTVAYTYHAIIFYVNYYDFKAVLEYRVNMNDFRRVTYVEAWNKLKSVIETADTVYLSQKTFDDAGIIPFDDFLIGQTEHNKCSIRDKDGHLQTMVIRKAFSNFYNPGIWTGWLYFLPGSKEYFIQDTDIIS